jgi:hypothetical protein
MYVHGKTPQPLYVEFEGDFPQLWIECDEKDHQYPRAFDVHNTNDGAYTGNGTRILSYNTEPWEFYDAGPSTTEAYNESRLPNVAPYKY